MNLHPMDIRSPSTTSTPPDDLHWQRQNKKFHPTDINFPSTTSTSPRSPKGLRYYSTPKSRSNHAVETTSSPQDDLLSLPKHNTHTGGRTSILFGPLKERKRSFFCQRKEEISEVFRRGGKQGEPLFAYKVKRNARHRVPYSRKIQNHLSDLYGQVVPSCSLVLHLFFLSANTKQRNEKSARRFQLDVKTSCPVRPEYIFCLYR